MGTRVVLYNIVYYREWDNTKAKDAIAIFVFWGGKKNRDTIVNITAAADSVDNIRPHLYAAPFITATSHCTYRATGVHACILPPVKSTGDVGVTVL